MILFVWVISFFGFSPEKQDTVSLSPIEIEASFIDRYDQGQKQVTWEKKDLASFQSQSLARLLAAQSPVFIREYGPGMLASPSFRGTSAGHTSIFWNGIPLNSPSLGQSDLSLLPVFAFESASLHFGSNGALIGNEAIGGSLHLHSNYEFEQGFSARFSQEMGSFGQANTQIKGSYSSDKLYFQSKFYRQSAENNYTFKNLALPGTPIQEQDHAEVNQMGYSQDFAWKINNSKKLKTSFWYHEADREILPPMGSNSQDRQRDQSFRTVVDYEKLGKKSSWLFKGGLVREKQVFNESINLTNQLFLGAEWDYQAKEDWFFHLGTRLSHIQGDLDTYEAVDQRIELFQSIRYQPKDNFSLALNLRQLSFADQLQPWIPSIGMDWEFWKKKNQSLKWKASLGRGFKVPTLNDRFWNPGGNPELLPEKSWTAETGLEWKAGNFSQSLTTYRLHVENWIIWLPQGSFWSPQNIREVRSDGIEYQGSYTYKSGNFSWSTQWQYSLNRAVTVQSDSEMNLGRQLPYTPRHQASLLLRVTFKQFQISSQNSYNGNRKITADSARSLNAFFLNDLHFDFLGLSVGNVKVPLQFRIQNIGNTDYQVIYLRPMPGRSYHFNLSIQL
ncbi:iron complex outermembrane recepter protein [Algoriphagus faecimaris]|uniref:Iron complex outermembrane recepter protein n=1 Tax=Algoriphagus faecimaris TaxID=686796 RepID=A0A1G6VXH4_9BACT|nr:TonB-dependent receptor [Algoriphagus faecimaris]SDD58261.1 iron complex outermembrane recepter protein [Algoriphagus faecimaris]